MKYKQIIFGVVVVLYEPQTIHFNNIKSYYQSFDNIVVVDNSKESNLNKLNEFIYPNENKLVYKHYPDNIGLSRAFNEGIEYLEKNGCDWAITMDADSYFISDLISVYNREMEHFTKQDIAVLSPVHIFDRSKNSEFQGIREIEWSMTSGCAFNISIFKKLGGFNKLFFVDGLDIEYCYRASREGYKIVKCGQALLQHYPGETRQFKIFGHNIIKYGYASPWRYYLQSKAIIFIFFSYKKPKELLRYLSKLAKVIFFFDNKIEYFKAISKGTIEGIKLCRYK